MGLHLELLTTTFPFIIETAESIKVVSLTSNELYSVRPNSVRLKVLRLHLELVTANFPFIIETPLSIKGVSLTSFDFYSVSPNSVWP